MEQYKVFLDTNIIMYFLCQREHMAEAATILDMGKKGEIVLFCSALTIANCVYNCRKVLGKEITATILKRLSTFIGISSVGQDECVKAFDMDVPDFEDAMQYFSAHNISADLIITRNPKHFAFSTIPIMDGAEFLANRGN